MRIVLLFVCSCLCIVLAEAQTLSPQQFSSTQLQSIAANKNEEATYTAQVYLAIEAANRQDFKKADEALQRAIQFGIPNSEWFSLRARIQLAQGLDSLSLATLKQGREAYPYSSKLAFEDLLREAQTVGQLPSSQAMKDLPTAARFQFEAYTAFIQGDWVNGLLKAEAAHYAERDRSLPYELTQLVNTVYQRLLQDSFGIKEIETRYKELTFERSYATSIYQALQTLKARNTDNTSLTGDLEIGTRLERITQLRLVALREFAKQGHLGRFNNELLVDLWVLDQAGHLEWATLQSLAFLAPESFQMTARARLTKRREAEAYIATQWANDVNSWLEKVSK